MVFNCLRLLLCCPAQNPEALGNTNRSIKSQEYRNLTLNNGNHLKRSVDCWCRDILGIPWSLLGPLGIVLVAVGHLVELHLVPRWIDGD